MPKKKLPKKLKKELKLLLKQLPPGELCSRLKSIIKLYNGDYITEWQRNNHLQVLQGLLSVFSQSGN